MFSLKTWKDRVSQFPARRILTDTSTNVSTMVTVARAEGTVTEEGDAYSAENMNGLETRIKAECDLLEKAMANQQTGSTASTSFSKGSYLVWNGKFYIVTRTINTGDTLTVGNNITQTSIGDQLRTAMTGITNANNNISSLANSTNNAVNSLTRDMQTTQNTVDDGFAKRAKSKFVSFTNFAMSGGVTADLTINCSDVLASRAWGLTVTPEGGTDLFGAILTNATPNAVTFTIKCITNPSFTGTITRLDVLVWGY